MEAMQQHLRDVSLFGNSALALVLILGVNLGLTLVHSLQELNGKLWRYFGAIAGIPIPDWFGFLVFFLGLTITLWVLGFAGIGGSIPLIGSVGKGFAIFAIGALIGGRLSDTLYSHVRLDRQGYRPNPGLSSTPYYVAEAIILLVLFSPGLLSHYIWAISGFIAGWMFFYLVLPALRLLRIIPFIRREPWKGGESFPSWAKELPT